MLERRAEVGLPSERDKFSAPERERQRAREAERRETKAKVGVVEEADESMRMDDETWPATMGERRTRGRA